MNLQNMTFKYKLLEMEGEVEHHKSVTAMYTDIDATIVEMNL